MNVEILGIRKLRSWYPAISWQINGETVADFIFLGSKITANGDCRHEIKRRLERKSYAYLDDLRACYCMRQFTRTADDVIREILNCKRCLDPDI